MHSDHKSNLYKLSKLEFFSKGIFDQVKHHLKGEVFEVGSGYGALTRLMEDKFSVTATDKVPQEDRFCKCKIEEYDITEEPEIESYYDSLISVNVLEHIEDDEKAVINMHKLLNKGGNLVLYVPAHPSIFGRIDRLSNHYRRYSKKRIEELIGARFKIESIKYTNPLGFFGWIYQNKVIKKNKFRDIDLKRFNYLYKFQTKIESFINPPFGLSLLIIARK